MKPMVTISRIIIICVLLAMTFVSLYVPSESGGENTPPLKVPSISTVAQDPSPTLASQTLETLEVKGRSPKTGYSRTQFGDGWEERNGCDMRNVILLRDLMNTTTDSDCHVLTGVLQDSYTGVNVTFVRGEITSQKVQIDHIVSLSNAWQTGAQQLTLEERIQFANDPQELIAVDGTVNQQKSDSDAASWLPPNKPYRCQYVSQQIAIKAKYRLWVTPAEKGAMTSVLSSCPIVTASPLSYR